MRTNFFYWRWQLRRLLALSITGLAFWTAAATALAGPGHDHGDEGKAAPSGPAQPRAVASSDLFEMVAVLDGKQLTVFVDRAATNEPVPGATLEIEVAGQKLQPQAVAAGPSGAAAGDFIVLLPEVLKAGVYAVTATIRAGNEVDLLAGELDVHDAAHADDHAHGGWLGELVAHGPPMLAGLGGALVVLVLGTLLWRRRSGRSNARGGVAA